MKSMFVHHFYQCSSSVLRKYTYTYTYTYTFTYTFTYTYTHTYTHTWHMTVMLENGGNFENGMPIPDYRIYLVLNQIPYEWRTKSNIQE